MKATANATARVAKESESFQALHAAIGAAIESRWPDVTLDEVYPDSSYDMPAFLVPLADHPPKEEWKGTMPNDVFLVSPVARAAGTTIHMWHPNHPYLLKENAEWLKEAGFKPMVGCLQWNRKAELPLDAVERLLDLVG